MPAEKIILFGQIFGICLAVLSFFVYLQKSREKILITKIILDILNVFQHAMVGAYTGSVINGIAVLREFVFYHKDNKKWAGSRIWLFVFLFLMIAASLISWQGYISFLPTIGSSLVVIGFYCSNPRLIRILGILGQSFWLLYSGIVFNLGGILGSALCIFGGIIGLIKNDEDKTKWKKEEDNESNTVFHE